MPIKIFQVNHIRQSMRISITILICTILYGCSDRNSKRSTVSKNDTQFEIFAIAGMLPLHLEELNFQDKKKFIYLNDGIVSKIEAVIKDYAKDIEFYDSTQSYKDTYINTIQLHDSLYTMYLVLLKHYPTGVLNSKVLFYDNQKKEFAENEFDFNLWALYDFENEKLTPTNLKTIFKINSPEIEAVDFNKDKIKDFKFVRLWHNGTSNTILTTILTLKNNKIDTLFFDKKNVKTLF